MVDMEPSKEIEESLTAIMTGILVLMEVHAARRQEFNKFMKEIEIIVSKHIK